MKKHAYYFLTRFYPRKYRQHFEKVLLYGGDTFGVRYWLGSGLLLALLVWSIFVLYPLSLYHSFSWLFLLYGFFSFFLIQFFVYLFAYFKCEERKEQVEKALPDFLQLMASNVRAGMTPFQAMRLSLREEFGPLKDEFQFATTKALGTENFSQVLLHIKDRVPSELFHRTLELLTSSLKAGGKLSQLLEDLAKEVIEVRTLRRELISSTRTYSMFVLFTVLIGAPLLFSISTHFLGVMTGLQASTGVASDSALVGEIGITVDFFVQIAYIFLILTSILASVLIGVIKVGDYFYGLRYAPFIASGSVILFLVLRSLVGGFLG